MDWIARITDIVKLPTRYVAIVAVVTGTILFLPATIIQRLHFETLNQRFGFIVGLVFLITSALVVVNSAAWLVRLVNSRRNLAKHKQRLQEHIQNLDSSERAVLREFFIHGQNTIRLPFDNPVVAGLISHGIIRQVGNFGEGSIAGILFSFRISEFANEFITPEVLDFKRFLIEDDDGKWMVTDDGKSWLLENRPHFVGEIERHETIFHRW